MRRVADRGRARGGVTRGERDAGGADGFGEDRKIGVHDAAASSERFRRNEPEALGARRNHDSRGASIQATEHRVRNVYGGVAGEL